MKCEILERELTSGYKAEKAKDAVGETEWNKGVVSRTLKVKPRKVILTRFCKPLRVVPMDEYAENVKQTLEENGVLENGIPFSNVTPAQCDALFQAGVKITPPVGNGKNEASMNAYDEWLRSVEENANLGERNGAVAGNSSSEGRLSSAGKAHLSHVPFSPQFDVAKIQKDTKIAKNKIKKSQNIGNVSLVSNDIDDIVRGVSNATGLEKSDSSNSHYGNFYEGNYNVEGKLFSSLSATKLAIIPLVSFQERSEYWNWQLLM